MKAWTLSGVAEKVSDEPWLAVSVCFLHHACLTRCECNATGLEFQRCIPSLPKALNFADWTTIGQGHRGLRPVWRKWSPGGIWDKHMGWAPSILSSLSPFSGDSATTIQGNNRCQELSPQNLHLETHSPLPRGAQPTATEQLPQRWES